LCGENVAPCIGSYGVFGSIPYGGSVVAEGGAWGWCMMCERCICMKVQGVCIGLVWRVISLLFFHIRCKVSLMLRGRGGGLCALFECSSCICWSCVPWRQAAQQPCPPRGMLGIVQRQLHVKVVCWWLRRHLWSVLLAYRQLMVDGAVGCSGCSCVGMYA